MAQHYVAAVDQGTTSTRCIVFDADSRTVAVEQREHRQIFPRPGWVEHDALEIWERVEEVVAGALRKAGLGAGDLAALGITNQRETTVVWDKETGRPIHHAIVWQDSRTDHFCDELAHRAGGRDAYADRTGLPISSYFSAPKIRWLLDNVPGAHERAARGELLFGTMDSWLIWNLTGGKVHVTDVTNASRTMLMDLDTLAWDEELLDVYGIPQAMLPKIRKIGRAHV